MFELSLWLLNAGTVFLENICVHNCILMINHDSYDGEEASLI